MVEKITDFKMIEEYSKSDLFSCRILSLACAYGFEYDFALFYRQIIDGKNTAIISRLDGDITVSFTQNADVSEIEEFCEIIGFNTLLTSEDFISDRSFTKGFVMVSTSKVELELGLNYSIDRYPKLMELFNFLDYDKADFESWYVDICHRIRHGCSQAYTLNFDDTVVSSAILSSIYKETAVLSAVQTLPEFRKMGFGSLLVSEILSDFNGKIFLMRDKNLNESFYSRLGFKNIGMWRMYK